MPLVDGLKQLLTDAAGWLALMASPVLLWGLTQVGLKIARSDDAVDTKAAQEKMKRVAFGVGIAMCAPWLTIKIMGYFAG